MDLSVVVVSFNGKDYLRRCLASLLEHTKGVSLEAVVVDNASWDGSAQMVEDEFPQVAVIRLPANVGFAAGCNRGIERAAGDFVLLLNPDAELGEDAFSPMVAYCREHPSVGILGPKLLNSDGSLQLSCRHFPSHLTSLFNRQSVLTRLFPKNPFSRRYLMTDWSHDRIEPVDWLSGACIMLSREMVERIGGMDEGYFMYIEDVDLCYRAHQAGYEVVYFPRVAVTHHIGRSTETMPNRSIVQWHRSMWRYYRKHMRGNPLLDVATLLGIVARCAYQLAVKNARRLLGRARA
jgi:GT2 family glycosyltransferase